MSQPVSLTHASFTEFVRSNKFALIHFWASWNGYDTELGKFLALELTDEPVAFGTFSVDPAEHHEVCRQHRILSLPFLEFYQDGSLANTATGIAAAKLLVHDVKRIARGD